MRWFHRFRIQDSNALSPGESAAWAGWAADTTHLAAFRRVEKLWDELEHANEAHIPTQQELDADGYHPDLSVSEWQARDR